MREAPRKLKMTPQRLAILDYLRDNVKHPSAETIFKAMKDKFPTMSFATVYNTLSTLSKANRLRELTIDPEKKRFDPDLKPHHHLICIRCGKIVDVKVDYGLKLPYAVKKGFEIIGNHIEFYGICDECRSLGK
ncbi:MAG TPA: transcriptional repressor [Thermodesulfovibrionales bacterium]|nr:transcriptional repressor [Thermodesulfovibrionales bacterium]